MSAEPADHGGVLLKEGERRQVLRMTARRGAEQELSNRFQAHFALELPLGPNRTEGDQLAVVGVAPGSWLVMDMRPAKLLDLLAVLAGAASLCELSDAYVFHRVMGPKARATLAKLVSLDLHASEFPIGRAASTRAAHVSVLLWRLHDQGGAPVFELAVPASYARYTHSALEHAAAEFQPLA